jgi:hypothetical protein
VKKFAVAFRSSAERFSSHRVWAAFVTEKCGIGIGIWTVRAL